MDRPSRLLADAVKGRIPLEEAPQEWLSFVVYEYAARVIGQRTLDERRDVLRTVPDAIKPLVQEEALKLWDARHTP